MPTRRTILALGSGAVLGVGLYAGIRHYTARAETATTLSPPDALAAAAAGEILLVDIRRPDEWRETGLPQHAVPIDMRGETFAQDVLAARHSEDQPVAVICARGIRSARVTRRLQDAGIGPIIDLPEGMLGSTAGIGWLARGLPVTAWN